MHLNNYDLIRLFAALQVATRHFFIQFEIERPFALLLLEYVPGVPIFFIVSGILVSQSLERSTSIADFAAKRALRIFPALWACLGVTIIVLAAFGFAAPALPFFMWSLAQATVVQFYNPDFLRAFGNGVVNGSLWTISVELQFYVALPLIAFMAKAAWLRMALLVAGILVSVAAYQIFLVNLQPHGEAMWHKLLGVSLAPYFFMFATGILIHAFRHRLHRLLAGRFLPMLTIFVAATFVIQSLPLNVLGVYLNPLSTVLLGLLVYSAAHTLPELSRALLRGNDVSYGLYIYHMLVINVMIELGIAGSVPQMLLGLAVSLALAFVSWVAVEKPALMLKRSRPAAAAPA